MSEQAADAGNAITGQAVAESSGGVGHGGEVVEGPRPTFEWGAVTHVGGVRDHNEDTFHVSDDVCVVADGMGGHEAGEVASGLVTRLVSEVFATHRLDVTELPRFVSALNAAVLRTGAENNTHGMGTTLVAVALVDNGDDASVIVFHVGDSRCYRLIDSTMTQVTTDHSHVQELVAAGEITAAEAAVHPLRNVITRALGADVAVEADYHVLAEHDCRLLLCSDGLSGELDDDRIWELLTIHADPSKAAMALVEAVLAGPARDNVTAIVVDVRFPDADPTDARSRPDLHLVDADDRDVTTDADVTAERGPWGPPAATERRDLAFDRPPELTDEPAWAESNQPFTDVRHDSDEPTPHEETGHDRQHDQ